MKAIPALQTERLILRPFAAADAAEVMRLAGDRALADTTLHIPHPYEKGMAEQWIGRHAENFKNDQGITWAVTRREDGALLGAISLMAMVKGREAELGYWIGKPYWTKGYCTEAGGAVLRYAFRELALGRVYASHFTRNPASGRVMQKIGKRHEGCRRQHVMKWGKVEDLEVYGIGREEWEQEPPANPARPT